jgi:hypothetical protein
MYLPDPSPEQHSVVLALHTSNVVCEAVAGSGKTTTVLHVARLHPDKKVLHLTYSAKLKAENRTRAEDLGLTNITVHSFHSAVQASLGKKCHTDTDLITQLRKFEGNHPEVKHPDVKQCDLSDFFDDEPVKAPVNPLESVPLPTYDIMVVDECQDMSLHLYAAVRLLCKLHTIKDSVRFLILGDARQTINEYIDADQRFLTMAEDVFRPLTTRSWVNKALTTSYRLTEHMGKFVTNTMRGPFMHCPKSTPDLVKLYTNTTLCDAAAYVVRSIQKSTVPREDMVILFNSVRPSFAGKNKKPFSIVAGCMSHAGIDVFIPHPDSKEPPSERVLKNKVCFMSFNSTKGLEFSTVFVFNFDASFFFGNEKDPGVCPNLMYVACTRATDVLSVFQIRGNDPLLCVDTKVNPGGFNLIGQALLTPLKRKPSPERDPKRVMDVNALIRHLTPRVMQYMSQYYMVEEIRSKTTTIPMCTNWAQVGGKFEEVSYINKYAILSDLVTSARMHRKGCNYNHYNTVIPEDILCQVEAARPAYLRALASSATAYVASTCDFEHLDLQINKYDWLTADSVLKCRARLLAIYGKGDGIVNARIGSGIDVSEGIAVYGVVDYLIEDSLYMIDCHASADVAQTCLETALNASLAGKESGMVYNVLTDTLTKVTLVEMPKHTIVSELVKKRLMGHAEAKYRIPDDVFINRTQSPVQHLSINS